MRHNNFKSKAMNTIEFISKLNSLTEKEMQIYNSLVKLGDGMSLALETVINFRDIEAKKASQIINNN